LGTVKHLVVAYGDKITSSKFEAIITELPSLIRCAAIDNSNFNAWFSAWHNVVVTSRSGALTKLILWGHLLASDLDFYDDKTLILDDDALWLMTGCFTIVVYRCYW
jgi:hypothetical protein